MQYFGDALDRCDWSKRAVLLMPRATTTQADRRKSESRSRPARTLHDLAPLSDDPAAQQSPQASFVRPELADQLRGRPSYFSAAAFGKSFNQRQCPRHAGLFEDHAAAFHVDFHLHAVRELKLYSFRGLVGL